VWVQARALGIVQETVDCERFSATAARPGTALDVRFKGVLRDLVEWPWLRLQASDQFGQDLRKGCSQDVLLFFTEDVEDQVSHVLDVQGRRYKN